MELSEFRENYEQAVNAIIELDNKNFNVFKILGLTDYEIRHSNFLAWLLTDDEFRSEFINACGIKINTTGADKPQINREKFFEEKENGEIVTYYKDKKSGKYIRQIGTKKYTIKTIENEVKGQTDVVTEAYNVEFGDIGKIKTKAKYRYIDLCLIGKDYTITIENKVDSSEHDFQCRAYRNYINQEYKDYNNFFVYLAKQKPENFDKSNHEEGLYPEYRYIGYETVRKILESMRSKFNGVQLAIINQYIAIINEWEKVPEEYVKCISNNCDIIPIIENNIVKKMDNEWKDKLSEEEKRFIRLASDVYYQRKKIIDERISPILEKIVKDIKFIHDYSDRYAKGIQLPNIIGDNKESDSDADQAVNNVDAWLQSEVEKVIKDTMTPQFETVDEMVAELKKRNKLPRIVKQYENSCEEKKKQLEARINKEIENIINKEIKPILDKIKKPIFKTVDYRAPIGEYRNVSIALIAGRNVNYSTKLCNW